MRVTSDPRLGGYVRRELIGFAYSQGIDEAEIADFLTAVGEALANAIEHSHSEPPIEVSAWVWDDRLFVSVCDEGVGFPAAERPLPHTLPDALAERGRGLPIMQRYADVFSVRTVPGQGTRVTLGRHVQRASKRGRQNCAS